MPIEQKTISDARNTISHWGVVGAKITTESGIVEYGYTGTHAELAGDQAIAHVIEAFFGPILIGENPLEVNTL